MIVGIETGGTKVVCAAADRGRPEDPLLIRRFLTASPDTTVPRIREFLDEVALMEPIQAIGVASFGPVDAAPHSDRFGWVTKTPKPGWSDVDLLGRITAQRDVPVAFVSDVTAAAVAEFRHGAGRGSTSVAYATIGTGVGVGLVLNGVPLGGNGWPEVGHLLVRRHPEDDFIGTCPFHRDCLEGLTAGPAVLARWGEDASSFRDDVRDSRLEVLAFYVAQMVLSIVLTTGVDRFVLGGGVMQSPGLLDLVRLQLPQLSAGYGPTSLAGDPRDLLVAPEVSGSSGVVGAMTLAADLVP